MWAVIWSVPMPKKKSLQVPKEVVERRILEGRGAHVMLDEHLAELYGVSVSALIQAMKRNLGRFPEDFVFQMTEAEWRCLQSQNVIAKPSGRGGRRTPPYAFTEHGILMLSSVLRSERAVSVNIEIMRTFVRLREFAAKHSELASHIRGLEEKYDEQFRVVFDALRRIMEPPDGAKRRRIGFDVGQFDEE